MSDLMSRFKASSAEAAEKLEEKVNKIAPKKSNSRAGFLSIDQGDNKFRIYPYHPDGSGTFYAEPKLTVWMEVMVPERDDEGNETGKKTLKRKPIFNSRMHGDMELDLVEKYIELAKKKVEEDYSDKKEAKSKISNLFYGMNGLSYKGGWVMYADKHEGGKTEFGRLEVTDGTFDKIKALAAEADDPGQPLNADPFTHPTDGIALILTKNTEKGVKPQDMYKVKLESRRSDKFNYSLVPTPLSEEQLNEFLTMKPLSSLFNGVFRKQDFLYQLEGIQKFDEDNDIGIFVEGTEWFNALMETATKISDVVNRKEVLGAKHTGEVADDGEELPFKSDGQAPVKPEPVQASPAPSPEPAPVQNVAQTEQKPEVSSKIGNLMSRFN